GSLGTNALLRDGARPALHPDDLLPPAEKASRAGTGLVEALAEEPMPPLPGVAQRLWLLLPAGTQRGADELAAGVGTAVDEVLAALLELELGGWVARLPGPVYCRRD